MLSSRLGRLAARTVFYISTRPTARDDHAIYVDNSQAALDTLNQWYNQTTGLWDTAGWWNCANTLTVLGNWAAAEPGSDAASSSVSNIMSTTFANAQQIEAHVQKTVDNSGHVKAFYSMRFAVPNGKRAAVHERGFAGFINEFYDDEGWWALAWTRAWDVTNDSRYLSMAESIFEDMKGGTDDKCGGGIWWSKERAYKNAIANELYLSLAASLASRVADKREYYAGIAKSQWTWFLNSGMINNQSLVNDGLNIDSQGNCVNNGALTWSYNQGTLLEGLVELNRLTGDDSYLSQATAIAKAAIGLLASKDTNVIHEVDGCDTRNPPDCGSDGAQFRGVFVRNLQYLHKASPDPLFQTIITANADSIWASGRNPSGQLELSWEGLGGAATAGTHTSAMDVLVAAMSIS